MATRYQDALPATDPAILDALTLLFGQELQVDRQTVTPKQVAELLDLHVTQSKLFSALHTLSTNASQFEAQVRVAEHILAAMLEGDVFTLDGTPLEACCIRLVIENGRRLRRAAATTHPYSYGSNGSSLA